MAISTNVSKNAYDTMIATDRVERRRFFHRDDYFHDRERCDYELRRLEHEGWRIRTEGDYFVGERYEREMSSFRLGPEYYDRALSPPPQVNKPSRTLLLLTGD